MLHNFPDLIRAVAAFAAVLGVLVFVHELGHYLAARWCRVHVEVFSIGFGRALTSWRDRHGTVWKVAWLPLGGYVKLHGQERPQDVPPEVRASWIPGRTFHDKSVGARAIIVGAGPIANFLLAMVLFAAVFATAGKPTTQPIVSEVLPGSAASRGGLMVGDRVQSIAGEPIHDFADIQRIIAVHPDETLALVIQRNGATQPMSVHTDVRPGHGRPVGLLGIAGVIDYQHYSLGEAIIGGVQQTWDVTADTMHGLAQMITGRRSTEDLGGPLRIAQLSGQVAELGIASLVSFAALLSVNLGLINLFPIPVLDGGHLVFYFAEALRGRPIPPRAQEYSFRAGVAVLATLFIFATWNDLTQIGLFRWVLGLIG